MSAVVEDVVLAAVGIALVTGPALVGKRGWRSQAHKLAKKNDIALPDKIEVRVARWLKVRYVLTASVVMVIASLLDAAHTRFSGPSAVRMSSALFTMTLLALPLAVLVVGFIAALPRWNRDRERRVAHFTQATVAEIFTDVERLMLALGGILTATVSAWGLHYVGSNTWWYLWIVPVGIATVCGRWSVNVTLSRPSAATDTLELGWDDLLRFQRAREVAISAAWGPALAIGLIDYAAVPHKTFDLLLPFLVLSACITAVGVPYRQGRDLWRNAWAIPRPESAS